ncbi:DUF2057 domain-containing protein [Photobacterium damselae subsp. damselae]|nr:DUF2057 domain-containing protein [Photobacterium damselae subsp. damselae]
MSALYILATQRQELLRSLYQQADETQRKEFMRWALGL